ncbi:MAG TPA: MgtC/SapB family protein [Ktedonobacterales bacterium]|nr:MgtC/SapB family protein [Ktedonobacterales bacterium]
MISLGAVLARLLVALACGAVIGFEREYRDQAAGMKTLALVSLGSALITIVSAYGFEHTLALSPNMRLDPSRVAAQIVSGIGFLGAGAILLRRELIRGLTTAASIWLVAGIGLAAGAGLLDTAVVGTVIALLALLMLRLVERRIFPSHSAHRIRLRVEPPSADVDILAEVHAIFSRWRIGIQSLDIRPARKGQLIDISCRVFRQHDLVAALGQLHALPQVKAMRAELVYSPGARFRRGQVDADAPGEHDGAGG